MKQPLDIRVPTRGGVGRAHGSSCRSSKDGGTGIFSKTPRTGFFRRRMIMRTSAARPCRSSGCDPSPSCVASSLAPRRDLKLTELATASERRALALLPICPPPTPTPSSHRLSLRTLLCQKHFADAALARLSGEYLRVFSHEKNYRTIRAGDPCASLRIL
jgi:hypothetical protein